MERFDITVKPLVDLYQQYQTSNTLPPADRIEQTLQLIDYRQIEVVGQRVAFQAAGDGHHPGRYRQRVHCR